jgi:glycosyltransferase involved in cell wall biosynthesis
MSQEATTANQGAGTGSSAALACADAVNLSPISNSADDSAIEHSVPVEVTSPPLDGVNVAGYLTAESGVGEAARGYVRALQQCGIPVALNNFDVAVGSRKADRSFSEFAQNNPFAINLICINADQLPAFVQNVGEGYFQGKYNIGVWWWELPDFPQENWSSFRWLDEIWVGSSFIQQSLSRYSPIPIVRIPPAVSINPSVRAAFSQSQQSQRHSLALPADEFLFLFMFDFFSGFERKNPLATVRAFKQAFKPSEPVRLVMKCINSQKAANKLQQLQEAVGDARVTILDRYLSGAETTGLIAACDAYVSMHRSEGLGLPLVEAMLLQKPVIATGWSGNADFMTVSNSYPLPYKLIVNNTDVGPYRTGELWAEPDQAAAAQAMRAVFSTRAETESRLRMRQASVDAQTNFSEQAVAALINGRLAAIRCFHPPKNDQKSTAPAPYLVDQTVQKQLDIIATGGTVHGGAESAKSMMRKFLMPIVERAGYLNSIYLQLFRRIFSDSSATAARLDLIDSRTRSLLAGADARISQMEQEIETLRTRLHVEISRNKQSGHERSFGIDQAEEIVE